MSLTETAKTGSRLDTLRVLRDSLATQLDACESGRDYAALSLRLVDVLEQIEVCEAAAPDAAKGTALDEFTRRRQQQAAGSPATAKRKQRG